MENPPTVKKCFLRQTHREGNPPLNPPGRCAPPLGQRKTKTISRNTRCFFPWLLVFSQQRPAGCREPMGSFYGASGRASGFDKTRAFSRLSDRDNNFFLEIFSNDIFTLSKGSHTYKWMLYLITKDITEHRSKPHNKPSCVFCIKMNTRRTYTWMIESCIWVWHYSFLRRTVKTYPSSWSFWSARLRLWAMADTPEKSSAMNIRIQRIGQEVVTPVWVKTTETCRLAWVGTLHIAIVSGCSIWTEHDVCSCLLGG